MTYTETTYTASTTQATPTGHAAIAVTGLRKRFGDHVVLEGLDLTVAPGEVYALLGPNGAGKSTLIRILTTLSTADGGAARVAGHDVATDPMAVRRAISVTGQATAVDELLTGRENLEMLARIAGLPRVDARRRADELLARFDLLDEADRRTGSYSGGTRRRLDLAASLVVVPAVLFLDEPTTGLDTRSRQTLWRRIEELATSGVTIFLTTQYLEEADELADRIGVLDCGRLVAEGTPAELKARVGSDVLVLDIADPTMVATVLAVVDGTAAGRAVHVPTDGSADHVRAVLATLAAHGVVDVRVRVHAPTLDDVFIALTEVSS
jgi:ABC-2 type transport system ATP-binding protein